MSRFGGFNPFPLFIRVLFCFMFIRIVINHRLKLTVNTKHN